MEFELVDRKKLLAVVQQCRSQLAPSPNRDTLVMEHLGIHSIMLRSDPRLNRARVNILDKRQYVLAKLRYGF